MFLYKDFHCFEFEVESIEDCKIDRNELKYLVNWSPTLIEIKYVNVLRKIYRGQLKFARRPTKSEIKTFKTKNVNTKEPLLLLFWYNSWEKGQNLDCPEILAAFILNNIRFLQNLKIAES